MKKRKHSKRNGNGKYGWLLEKLSKPVYLSREEILHKIEKEALEIRGVGAHELLSAYRKRTLKNPGEVMHLLILSGLLPENDPVFA